MTTTTTTIDNAAAAEVAAARPDDAGRGAIAAAVLGFVTTLATGVACVGPFVAILLGVGGFGWLTQYAYLRVPATVLTVAILAYGFHRVYGARRACQRPGLAARVCLWSATALALGLNLFEYFVLPRL